MTSNPKDNERGQATGAKDTDRGVEEVAVEGGPYDETVDVNEALEAAEAEGRAEGGADDRA